MTDQDLGTVIALLDFLPPTAPLGGTIGKDSTTRRGNKLFGIL
jgi:hypothetical protein